MKKSKGHKEIIEMKGTLDLISSKNAPVFDCPLEIEFHIIPRLGDPFLFTSKHGLCNTSDIRVCAVDSESNAFLLQTLNSVYKLSNIQVEL